MLIDKKQKLIGLLLIQEIRGKGAPTLVKGDVSPLSIRGMNERHCVVS
jgi:hypothetical protein